MPHCAATSPAIRSSQWRAISIHASAGRLGTAWLTSACSMAPSATVRPIVASRPHRNAPSGSARKRGASRRQNSAVVAALRKTSRRRLCSGLERVTSRPSEKDTASENSPLVPTRFTAS